MLLDMEGRLRSSFKFRKIIVRKDKSCHTFSDSSLLDCQYLSFRQMTSMLQLYVSAFCQSTISYLQIDMALCMLMEQCTSTTFHSSLP